ncbi:MAG: gliding motility protein GldC [Flavisolibacter sp.]|nr:gliding motility protein GldC [Flavisolibacter sp.]
MNTSTITINVELDEGRVPQRISWQATESTAVRSQEAKAFILSFWDSAEKTAFRIDLWTKKMMVDEMADFYFQTLMTMADTFERATQQKELVDDMKNFTRQFYNKFRELQIKENKAG